MRRARVDYAHWWLESHSDGTFHIDPDGYDDGSAYLVPVFEFGAPPIVDDAPAVLLSKVTYPWPLDILDRLGAMTPIAF